jgi:hypothetical protein
MLLMFSLQTKGQSIAGVEEKGILYNRLKHAGGTLHSSGIGINYRYGKNLSGYKYLLSDFQLLTMKHPKEIKTVNPFSDNNAGFIYGKLNSLISIRTGIGRQHVLNPKGDQGGVEISISEFAGASWGFAKPVYLSIFEFTDQAGVKESIQKFNPDIHYPDNISGRAPFVKGFGETKIHPGLYFSFLMNFEFGREQTRLRMVETGVTLDAYLKPVEMMAFNPPSSYFLTFFIRYLYGRKWNH